jgi:hypothetical protein
VAAGQVLADPSYGPAIAKVLEQQPFMYYLENDGPDYGDPGNFTVMGSAEKGGVDYRSFMYNQQLIENFLDAATTNFADPAGSPPRTGPLGYQAAQAAINIIENTPDPSNITITKPVRQALLTTYGRYMPDLAASTNFGPGQSSNSPQILAGVWNLHLDGKQDGGPVAQFIRQIAADPTDAGIMQGETASAMGNMYGLQVAHQGPDQTVYSSDLAADLASLYGMTVTQTQNFHYQQAEAEDVAHAQINTLISMAEAGAALIPGGGEAEGIGAAAETALKDAQAALPVGVPLIPTFSTDNASNEAAQDLINYAQDESVLDVPMVQGLVNAGVVTPQPSWYQNGQVVANVAFATWWQAHKGLLASSLPQYNEPPYLNPEPGIKPLPDNATNGMTPEAWQKVNGAFNMWLTRELQTEEGN